MNEVLISIGLLIIVGIFFYMQRDNKKRLIKQEPIVIESATFIESLKFAGSKKGYVYKMDSQGLGYYLDKNKNNDNII